MKHQPPSQHSGAVVKFRKRVPRIVSLENGTIRSCVSDSHSAANSQNGLRKMAFALRV